MKRSLLALTVGLALPACFPSEGPRFYPEWHRGAQGNASIAGCAEVDGWVAKTGKQGLGLVLYVRGTSPNGCSPAITSVELRIEDATYRAARLPSPPLLREGQELFVYVPIPFDGNDAWNDEAKRHATLTIATTPAATAPIVWPLALELRDRFPCQDDPPAALPPPPPPPGPR